MLLCCGGGGGGDGTARERTGGGGVFDPAAGGEGGVGPARSYGAQPLDVDRVHERSARPAAKLVRLQKFTS
jgi:hypothetical protein